MEVFLLCATYCLLYRNGLAEYQMTTEEVVMIRTPMEMGLFVLAGIITVYLFQYGIVH